MKLWYSDKISGRKWPAWKEENECSKEELTEANLRELKPTEIVLDYEDMVSSLKGIQRVCNDGYNFEAYNSGSRGYHLHLEFNELQLYEEERRKAIRLKFIKHYAADPSKQTGLIAMEEKAHFKTKNPKELMQHYNKGNTNTLPEWATNFVDVLIGSVCVDDREDLPDKSVTTDILVRNPKVCEAVMVLRGDLRPDDRSSKDFLITKCLKENSWSKMQIFNFLRTCKHSKVHTDGWNYYDYTYKQVIRSLNK